MDKLQKLFKDMDPSNSNLLSKMADDFTDSDPFLHLLFLSILKRPTTESVFFSLDARIVEYIIYEKFNISMKIEQRLHECKNPGLLLKTLLLLEKEKKDLYHVAPDYIKKLVDDCSRTFLETVVSENIVSGINNQIYANLDLTTDCLANDYKIFTQSCNFDYIKRFEILSNSNINIKRLFKYSLKNSEELTRELMVTYPELNYHRPYIAKNRHEIFNGLETPASKKSKMCYSFAMKIHIHKLLKTDTNTRDHDIIKYNKHLDALYKLIIIENSELTQDFCLDVLNQILDDNILVAELMVRRKFSNIYIDTIVEYVPLFAYVFQLSVNLYNSTQDKFYELLANKLYKKHRIGNIKELLNITKE